jgi:hypothetical protein
MKNIRSLKCKNYRNLHSRFKPTTIKGKFTHLKICLIQINFVSLYYESIIFRHTHIFICIWILKYVKLKEMGLLPVV